MTGKRIAALVAAVAMIAVAWTVRAQIDKADTDPNASSATEMTTGTSAGPTGSTVAPSSGAEVSANEIVCSPDLIQACQRAVAASGTHLTVTSDSIDTLLASPTDAPVAWVTLDPLPAALQVIDPSVVYTTTPVASSPLSLIVSAPRADALTATCGAVVTWRCLGEQSGQPWTSLGGEASWSTVRPGVSPSQTAIGAVSITAAVRSFFGSASINSADPSFIAWGRQLGRAVPASSLSAGTAVGTIQVRPSLLDIAVGVPAELSNVDDPRFKIVGVEGGQGATMDVVVVVATLDGTTTPPGFVDALRDELVANGWSAATASTTTSGPVTGGDIVAAVGAWNDVQN